MAMDETTGESSLLANKKLSAPSKVSWLSTVAWKKVDIMGSKSARSFTSCLISCQSEPALGNLVLSIFFNNSLFDSSSILAVAGALPCLDNKFAEF